MYQQALFGRCGIDIGHRASLTHESVSCPCFAFWGGVWTGLRLHASVCIFALFPSHGHVRHLAPSISASTRLQLLRAKRSSRSTVAIFLRKSLSVAALLAVEVPLMAASKFGEVVSRYAASIVSPKK